MTLTLIPTLTVILNPILSSGNLMPVAPGPDQAHLSAKRYSMRFVMRLLLTLRISHAVSSVPSVTKRPHHKQPLHACVS